MKTRQQGFYKVQFLGSWQVAYFTEGLWFITGVAEPVDNRMFNYIDDRPIEFETRQDD